MDDDRKVGEHSHGNGDAGRGFLDLRPSTRRQLATVLAERPGACQILGLTPAEQVLLLRQVILVVEQNYVNLLLKQNEHHVDPVGRLNNLLPDAANGKLPGDDFHRALTDILREVRDRHLAYELPGPAKECVAFLPFTMAEITEDGRRRYIVSQCLEDSDPQFVPGVEIVSWDGNTIDRAIADEADRQSGCSPDARRALAIRALTLRVLLFNTVPIQNGVDVGYVTLAGTATGRRFNWRVANGLRSNPASRVNGTGRNGDQELAVLRQLRRTIFTHGTAKVAARTARMSTTAPHLPPAPPTRDVDLSYMTLNAGAKSYGYIRIWTFAGQLGPTQFVNEFVKLLGKASASGLIIDIRDTPGRKIEAAERILQTLTGERITPEPFQFRNTDLNLRICMKGGDDEDDFRRWIPSIRAGLQNGKDYSDGFPKTDPALCNSVGRRYRGPVVLITSATTYSSADIFAAGFQDHKIGPVLGIHPTTGGGGANSTVHSDLEGLGLTNSPYAPLPQLAELRLALRRSLRVRGNEGVVLEDAGVKADVRHDVTRDDVLHGYPDMIQKAISLL